MKLQITIPTSLDEITLEQYQKFLSIAKDNPDGEFLQHKMVEIFCGIDLKNAAKISYKDVNEITTNLSNLFLQKYDGSYTYCEAMKFAPVDIALGAVVFFYNLGNELLKSTIHYLENNKEFQNIVNNHNLEVNGVGIHHSMLLLKEMLEDLKMSQNFGYQLH